MRVHCNFKPRGIPQEVSLHDYKVCKLLCCESDNWIAYGANNNLSREYCAIDIRRYKVDVRGANRSPKFRNSEIVRIPIRFSDGRITNFLGQFRTNTVT